MKKNIKLIASVLCALIAFGCNDADKMDYGKSVLLMTGTDKSSLVRFVIDEDDPSTFTYPVTVSATTKLSGRTTVNLKIDNSLVEKYNADNRVNFYALPDGVLSLDKAQVTIEPGKTVSSSANLTFSDPSVMEPGRVYIIPVTITSADSELDVLESSRTAYLRVANTISFTALDITNYNIYSNYIFPDEKAIDLPTFTYEIKCYWDDYKANHTNENISRLVMWAKSDESRQNMLRFNENGTDLGQLQWVTPSGNYVSKLMFQEDTWYTISLTFDGSSGRMYVDGVLDGSINADLSTMFQRLEFGMSYQGYNSRQQFRGRIAEVRIWNRPLSAGEIQLGLCGVDPASEGLMAYWKLDEGEGHIFHDSTNGGHDMDWSQTQRAISGDDLQDTPSCGTAVDSAWVFDDINKCAN